MRRSKMNAGTLRRDHRRLLGMGSVMSYALGLSGDRRVPGIRAQHRHGAHPGCGRLAGAVTSDQRSDSTMALDPDRTVTAMRKIPTQGVHHITLLGADRQTSIDFWEGLLAMPFVFEQPNLDRAEESHLYFDPGDGRLITIFTKEDRAPDQSPTPGDVGNVHHVAFTLSNAVFRQTVERLDERGIMHSGVKDRGFMDSIYFRDPLGLLIELASYRFEPPVGHTHADVMLEAHLLRLERGDYNIAPVHLADAIERLVTRSQRSLSHDRAPKNPYTQARPSQVEAPHD